MGRGGRSAMVCASCGWATQAGARFCGGCGASLAPRCPACGAETRPNARFCEACGAPLSARPADAGVVRKVVTVVFADLIGSTALHERLDPESVSRIMEGYHAAVRAPIEAHDGTVVQLLGDGVMCAFGVPRVAEDDALRAVHAAVDVQRSFRAFLGQHAELAGRVGLRVAVNTGEVVVSDDYAAGIGDPLNVAARLQQEAKDGDVLIGEATERLVADKVTLARVASFALKGRAEPVTAYRVVSLDRPAGTAATPFVGRDAELRRITAVYEAAVAAPAARLAVILGSPGLGKSRLLAELARQLEGRASVLTAQCNSAGGATFAPLAEALRTHFRLEAGAGDEALRAALDALVVPSDDAERAGIAVGLDALISGTPALPEEIFFVVRRLLSALAAERPVVLAIDDLQWAEPLLLDFTEHLVQWGAGVPLLVLATARPELRDTRSSFTAPGGLVSDVVTLGGLDAGAAMRLAANVIGADTLPAAVAGRVLTTSEGNPLFVGELVRMLVNDGTLRKEGERWTLAVDLAALEMPPTIQALLAARIERLRPEERLVLERAAVVGRRFSRAAVTHLLPREAHADLDARLEALRRSELVEPDAGWLFGEPALRFHHVLIRDAAYRRVLRGTRAELHARFAEWLEARVGESAPHDETIGWHLEQAHRHLRELGPLDSAGRALGERAGRYLAAAGRQALARDDLQPAASLLGRALDFLGDADPARAELAVDWCEALLAAGEVGPAAHALTELGRFTAGSERLSAWHTCFSGQLAALADPKALRASAEAVATAAEALAAAGDVAGEAKAHQVHADALARLGMIGACEAALDKALAAARRARDRRRANAVLAGAPLAALWGPSPVTRASGRCLDVVRVLRITQGAPAVEAVALRCQAVLETLRGRSEAARRMIASSRRLVEELGITQRLLEVDTSAGLIELLEGDAAAAERWLRPAYEGFRAHGLGVDAARAAALLGRALLAENRAAEAEALSHESEMLAGDDFKAAIAWRGVRAEALAGRGEPAAGVELARAAVEIAAATDDLLDHADARSVLAVALRAAGRSHEADAEEARAIELWEQKGATLLVERARRGGARAAPAERAPDARVARPSPAGRRVRRNAATETVARLDAAIAARDASALHALVADSSQALQHPIGFSESMRSLFASVLGVPDQTCRHVPLGTLGDSLALFRSSMAGNGLADGNLDVGAYDLENPVLIEIDADGRLREAEYFAADRLGDAVARLYARYAELLPEGPEKARAAATARSVATLVEPLEVDSVRAILAPDLEFVDRRILGVGSARGAEFFLRGLKALLEISADRATRHDDVFALRSDALLVRRTNSGTDRYGGGAHEFHVLWLGVFGGDGLLKRIEQFDAERVDEALARFDELTAEPPAPLPVRRRVRANAAIVSEARQTAAMTARDADAIAGLYADSAEFVHHPTGVTYDREGAIRGLRAFINSADLECRQEPLATLGDLLALCRRSRSASGFAGGAFDVGAFEMEEIALLEVDAQGRFVRGEAFALDRLGDAVGRLYERYAELLPEGPERIRAAATARSVATVQGVDLDRFGAALAPDVEFVDHRALGFGRTSGADDYLRRLESMLEVADDVATRIDDVLGLRPNAFLARWKTFGIDRAGGGAFENPFFVLWVFGADGLVERWEQFDAEQDCEALTRFDELTAKPPPERFANAAWRAVEEWDRAVERRDWDALLALHAPGCVLDDRRSLVRTRAEGEAYFANLRFVFDARPQLSRQLVATRGERLVLDREVLTSAASHGSLAEFELLCVYEMDTSGRRVAAVTFDPEDLDAAFEELDARYDAGEAAPYARTREARQRIGRALKAREWGALASLFSPDFVSEDHRRVGVLTFRSGDEYVASARAIVELAPDAVLGTYHVLALGERCALSVSGWTGTRDGGDFESLAVLVQSLAPDGRCQRFDMYDLDQLDAARARYTELAAAPPTPWIANAATRNFDRVQEAWAARDWERVTVEFAAEFHCSDRRATALLELDRDENLAFMRMDFELASSQQRYDVLATRGDRLALARVRVEGAADCDAGPSEIEFLILIEVNENGERVAVVRFDSADLDVAYTELDERYDATRRVPFLRAVAARDWDAVAALLAPDLVSEDHRLLGRGTLHGPAAYIAFLRTLVDLAPDAKPRADHMEYSGRGALSIAAVRGTWEGGAFENPMVVVSELDALGRVRRIDSYDLEQLAEARARFEALAAGAPHDPLAALVQPNAASAALDRLQASFEARDWAAVRALAPEGARFEDRRRHALVSGDVDWWLADLKQVSEADVGDLHYQRRLFGTAGDRICLERVLWTGGPADGRVEIEYLWLAEVDVAGRLVAGVMFDVDDRRAASREARARWLARDAAAAEVMRPALELIEALNDRDRSRARASLADDVVLQDRRRTGVGLIEGPDAYVESIAALWELAPEMQWNPTFPLALERHGWVGVMHTSGTLPEGGAFERPYVYVTIVAGGRIRRMELFEIEQRGAALARLAELRPDPLRIPPNAATRASDRWSEAVASGDWESVEALFAPTLVFEDRERRSLVRGDRELLLANDRLIGASRPRTSRTVLATAGDRLALQRILVRGTYEDVEFEREYLRIIEIDGDGRLVAVVAFDPDDRRAASRELLERWARSDAGRWLRPAVEFRRALFDRDLERVRAVLADDFVFDDHRRTGLGRLEGADRYVASLAALHEQSPDAVIEALYYVAVEKHGHLGVTRRFGTLAQGGGEFENVFARLELYEGDRIVAAELFELEDLELARARFGELRPAPARIPANAASRLRGRTEEAFAASDWDALRALASDAFEFDDRRKLMRLKGDVELWVRSLEVVRSWPNARHVSELIGTAGDRLAIERVLRGGEPDGGRFEIEFIRVTEVDADGRLSAWLNFDPDDRAAAFEEAHARFAAGEAAATGGQAPIVALYRSITCHDWETVRARLAEDAVMWDRRALGILGTLDRDQWVESLSAAADVAPDWDAEVVRILRWNGLGRVQLTRMFGMRDGGPFENLYVHVILTESDRIQRFEYFDLADADQAIARFEELCAGRE